jgi:iron complex outermembrane receptor protein
MTKFVPATLLAALSFTAAMLHAQTAAKPDAPGTEPIITLEKFVTSEKNDDPNYILQNDPNDATGFMKKPVETPRSMSVVSSEMISNLSLTNVTDLSVIAPNTFSTSRWGVQGNIDIRAQAADIYFRGMKRIEPQGNSRTALGANDQIEVVKGPPPPYFGAGKVGGYTNLTPKSGRSRKGAFLEKDEGFYQLILGTFGRREVSFGYGGPLNLLSEKKGGYYIYGLMDDSDTYFQHVPGRQRIIQAAISQDISKNWRMESGLNYQETISAGASTIRLTYDLVHSHTVWGGRPLVVLDTDGSGKISRKEMEINSPNPLTSVLSSNNMSPLGGSFSTPAMIAAANTKADLANPRANSALQALVQMRPDFVAKITDQKTLNLLNAIPRGLVMDPDTMHQQQMDFSAVGIEKELRAKLGLAYLDFINDVNPDLTMKNQMFFDSMDQFKDSEMPYYQKLDQYVVEDKFTVQKRFSNVPTWMGLNTITSANISHTRTGGMSGGGDYDDRADVTLPYNVRTGYDAFVSPKENSTYELGLPFSNDGDTTFTESGIGTMADISIHRLQLMLGGRFDYVDVYNIAHAGTFSSTKGTNGSPAGRYSAADVVFRGHDTGTSWTASVSYKLPYGIIPYYTYSVQSVLQDGGNISSIGSSAIVGGGVYEDATLKEVGIKGSMFNDTVYWAISAYQQGKSSVTLDTAGAEITSGSVDASVAKGAELELRWVPSKRFYATVYGVSQRSLTTVLSGTKSVRIAGTTLGFADVKDADGNVIYPAEAFTWGGQNTVNVPVGVALETPGYPNVQVGGSANYAFASGLSLGTSMNYNSAVQSGWSQRLILPAYALWNANVGYKWKGWTVKLDVMNVFDKVSFKARLGGSAGDQLLSVGLPRRYLYTLSKTF